MAEPTHVEMIAEYERHIRNREWRLAEAYRRKHPDVIEPHIVQQRAAMSEEHARGGYSGEEQE